MMERDGLDIRFAVYVWKFGKRYFAARMNFQDILYRESLNETLRIISYVSVYVLLLHCNNISFYEIPIDRKGKSRYIFQPLLDFCKF